MEALKIEILNPKIIQLIKGMEDLKFSKTRDEPASLLKTCLKKMRSKSSTAPDLDAVTRNVEDVREKRYAKK